MLKLCKLNHSVRRCLLTAFIVMLVACGGMDEQQMLQNAKTYLDKGDLMAASIELRNTLQKNNENAEARYLLGSISLKVGDLASAEKEFRRAADAGWNQEQVQLELARILISKKEFKKFLDEIETEDTWSIDTRANIAGLQALAEAGVNDITKAKNTLENGAALNKDAVQVLRSTAIFQLAGMLEGDASNTLKTAESLHPDNPEILLIHASNDIRNENLSRASDTYSRVIALYPATLLTANARIARIGLARLQLIEKSYDKADSTLEPLLKNNNKDPEANYLAGVLAFSQGDFSGAENHVRKLLAVVPDNSQAQLLMGKIKYALKDFDQAAYHLSSYLNAAPNDIDARKLLTNIYILLNQPEQARATLQHVLTANQEDAGALTLLSQVEFKNGNMVAGITALSKAVKSSPDNAELRKQLVKAYAMTGQTELAQSELIIYQKLSKDTEETQKLRIIIYLQAGQIEKALEIANEMLEKDPENTNKLALIGNLYANSGNNKQARTFFNKAMQIQQDHPAATAGLAGIERKNGNFDKAISLYESLVDSNTAGTMPMMALAEIAEQQKRTNDMLLWLEKARNAGPAEIRARLILANYYLRNAQPQKAETYAKEAIKQSPEQADLIALQGKVLIAQQRYSDALPPLKKLVAKLPESTTAHSLLGEAFLRQGILENARQHLQKALKIQQDNIIAISLLAETELKDGNLDKSLEYAKALQKVQPEHHIGYLQEGDVWMTKLNYKKAHSAYDKAWKQQQTAQLAKKLFSASKNTLNHSEAIKPLLTWLNNNPNDNATRFYLAIIYQDAEENDKAINEYEKVLAQSPDNSAVLNNLAWLYSLNGNPKAIDMAESAYRSSPENPGILDTYGWILVQQGQVEKGQRLIKQALDVIPGNLDIRYHYATALLKSGNDSEGKQILQELLKQNKPFSGREDAKRLLENL